MSELINNREQSAIHDSKRMEMLKQIFKDLNNGENVDVIKERFTKEIGTVSVDELGALQHGEMDEDSLTAAEMKRLYASHAEIFQEAMEKVEFTHHPEDEPGHPIHTFKRENKELETLITTKFQMHLDAFHHDDCPDNIYALLIDINLLFDIDKHYERKEQLIFPYLERYGIPGPTHHMWRIDDFIRDAIKDLKKKLTSYDGKKDDVLDLGKFVVREVIQMIYREENILFPMALMNFTEDEWVKIAHESDEIGFCLIDSSEVWKPDRKHSHEHAMTAGYIKMETGQLSLKQLELLLNHLPVDITFIDQDDVVRYFSYGKERIFARTKAVIGRTVQNCHPPRSVHVVEELLEDFKLGKKDSEDFWIQFKEKYVYIRYFAVRDEDGAYMGTIEFTQDIRPIQKITGEKRILS